MLKVCATNFLYGFGIAEEEDSRRAIENSDTPRHATTRRDHLSQEYSDHLPSFVTRRGHAAPDQRGLAMACHG